MRRTVIVAGCGTLAFALLAIAVAGGGPTAFDTAVRAQVHAWSSPLLTALMIGISDAGADWFLAALGTASVWWMLQAGRRRDAIILAIAALCAAIALEILKFAFHRPRPAPFFGMALPVGYSFPSGHAMKAAVFYILLSILVARSRAARAGAVALAGLIGYSRIYLGVHYPSDVLAGYAAAAVCLALACYRRMPVCPSE